MENVSTKLAFLIASAIGATAALPTGADAGPAPVPTYQFEKCYGIALAGKNDCAATNSHSCAGEATMSSDPASWIYLPAGSCLKINGASLTPKKA